MNRDELIERMARGGAAGLQLMSPSEARDFANAALSELEAAIPGLSDLIEGKAVVVPKEETNEMVRAAHLFDPLGCDVDEAEAPLVYGKIYSGFLSASPYAEKNNDTR